MVDSRDLLDVSRLDETAIESKSSITISAFPSVPKPENSDRTREADSSAWSLRFPISLISQEPDQLATLRTIFLESKALATLLTRSDFPVPSTPQIRAQRLELNPEVVVVVVVVVAAEEEEEENKKTFDC